MYIPPSFFVTDPAKLHDLIDQHGFATVISSAGDASIASHLPILLDREAGPHGRLIGPHRLSGRTQFSLSRFSQSLRPRRGAAPKVRWNAARQFER